MANATPGQEGGSSDEEMKEEYDLEQNESGASNNGGSSVSDHYWREKEKTIVSTRIYAHKCIIA